MSAARKTKKIATPEMRVCIADEEPLLSELMRYSLEEAGFDVTVYNSAGEAMDNDLTNYQLYIIDVGMDNRNGVELARYLKQNPETTATPLLSCSSRDSETDVIDCLDLGSDDYILKPFSMKELLARVNSLITR